MPTKFKANQMRVIHEFIRFLKKTNLTGFTTSSLVDNVCTGYWRANMAADFDEENVVLLCIDHALDRSDPKLWDFIAEMKHEIQSLYQRFAGEKEQDVWIVVHSIDRLV